MEIYPRANHWQPLVLWGNHGVIMGPTLLSVLGTICRLEPVSSLDESRSTHPLVRRDLSGTLGGLRYPYYSFVGIAIGVGAVIVIVSERG
jgi:hypothetical protein